MPGVTLKHRLLAVAGAPLLGLGFAVVAAAGLLLWVLLAPAKYLLRDAAGRRELAREGAVTLWVFLLVDSAFVGPAALGYALWGGGGLWLQAAAAAYVALMLGDKRAFTGRGTPFLRELGFWGLLREYFDAEVIKTAELDPDRRYVFGYHPHGVLSFGCMANFGTRKKADWEREFPGIDLRPLTLASQFRFPFWREICLGCGVCSVDRSTCERILAKGSGSAIMIVVGGAAEAVQTRPGDMELTLKKRKGFVRLALANGADLVPVITFGENEVFNIAEAAEGSLLAEMNIGIKAVFGITIPIFYGLGVTNPRFGLVPLKSRLVSVVGAPLRVEKFEGDLHASPEGRAAVDKLHGQYVEALAALYQDFKTPHMLKKVGTLRY